MMDSPPPDDYETLPSDIALTLFLTGMTPEQAERDRLPPPDSVERLRVDYLLSQRDYYNSTRRRDEGAA